MTLRLILFSLVFLVFGLNIGIALVKEEYSRAIWIFIAAYWAAFAFYLESKLERWENAAESKTN